ncbi:MAG: right-handed parallel beta-helix repeat-containing protein [Deltaproteobacteria bacterium]|uniref:Right-handed parallel beta-helix repeat-containing protein n=1 Tax=Candidatus Desulfacyla euxinica TaxID=2841693 RepID=A0A8J6MWI6_9DELT|nr:right-handed parallel beta-helix repeat-containing protein [Candidatus Desulfacyla euxinica]MBL7217514.1 right-handed parallel beta-helix repeat-containing protein [Desulfobacteraceae bacterium]
MKTRKCYFTHLFTWIVLLWAPLFHLNAFCATIRVPGDYSTIQMAIDEAFNGDTVEIADGTYTGEGNKDLNFDGKAITVTSKNGAANCIIDCGGNGTGFIFNSGETKNAVLSGVTITGSSGGGIRCSSSSSPTITRCIIINNVAERGAGINCQESSPTITFCTITGNTASVGGGGGIRCASSSSPTISDCNISGNTSVRHGGGIDCHSSVPTITNCIITGNTVDQEGGGIYLESSDAIITNCTIAGNSSESGSGGGIHTVSSSPTITNCILWDDSPQEIQGTGNPVVTFSDVEGGYSEQGNMNAAPLFLGGDDYHLGSSSPCINVGNNNAPEITEKDKDGNPRIMGWIVDMGAYEVRPVIYVSKNDDTCGGKSPCYTTIETGIAAATDETLIKITQENYGAALTLNSAKRFILQGGWDSSFIIRSSDTIINSLTISGSQETVTVEYLTIQ